MRHSDTPTPSSAYELLRLDLMNGFLPPAAKLQISALAERYDTSVGPIREALSHLAAEGLVSKKGQRGYWAAEISIAEFEEVSRLRMILETDALRRSIEQGDLRWESTLVGAMHRVKSALAQAQSNPQAVPDELIQENRAFHMALIAECGSERQVDFISTLYDQTERFRRRSSLNQEEVQQEFEEHLQLMEAALARDTAGACRLLKRHILEYRERVTASVSDTLPATTEEE